MPPWATLAKLPWTTILTQAAALLKQTNDLRVSRTQPPVGPPASNHIAALSRRLAELENQQRADAEIIQQLATQIAAIASAAEATAARLQRAYLIASAGIAFGVLAMLVAWFR